MSLAVTAAALVGDHRDLLERLTERLGAHGRVPTVDGEVGAGHERCPVGQEVQHGIGDLLGVGKAPEGLELGGDRVGSLP